VEPVVQVFRRNEPCAIESSRLRWVAAMMRTLQRTARGADAFEDSLLQYPTAV